MENSKNEINKRIQQLDPEKRAALADIVKEKMAQRERSPEMPADYDVVILGGGLAGSGLARQLIRRRKATRILVVEKSTFPCPEIAFKVGESVTELGSYYLREILELHDHLNEEQIEKAGVRYFFSFEDNHDITRRMEVGLKRFPPVPGYQLDRGRLENYLYKANCSEGVMFWDNCRVTDIAVGNPHKITVKRGTEEHAVTSKWIVDATGRAGTLKRKLDLAEQTQHASSSAWFRISGVVSVETWTDNLKWKERIAPGIRQIGTIHLMGKGYWVWIIVLPSNATSIGIVADPEYHPLSEFNSLEKMIQWLHKHEPQCAAVIEARKDQIQDFLAVKHFSHGCKRLFSKDRWCITGEAGVFADPFYSPGTDFISINNTLICDLLMRDFEGEEIAALAEQYNFNLLGLFKLYLNTYQNQYPVMGNEQVMLAKIIWDWAIYWGVNAFMFFRENKSFDLQWLSTVQSEMRRFNELNNTMQSLFKEWDRIENPVVSDQLFSLLDLEFLYKLHTGLVVDLDSEESRAQLIENIRTLEILAREYCRYVSALKDPAEPSMKAAQELIESLKLDQSLTASERMQNDLSTIWLSKRQQSIA